MFIPLFRWIRMLPVNKWSVTYFVFQFALLERKIVFFFGSVAQKLNCNLLLAEMRIAAVHVSASGCIAFRGLRCKRQRVIRFSELRGWAFRKKNVSCVPLIFNWFVFIVPIVFNYKSIEFLLNSETYSVRRADSLLNNE